ncbi:MAG: family 78 glycoside hydrolase catalytic domain, partial [Bacteroidota bacterium]
TQEFTPGWSHYPKRIFYQTYGLDSLVEAGVNEVVVPLGNLWWSSGLGWRSKSRYSDGPLRMKAAIVLRYQDGSEDIFPSDSSWRYLPSGEFRNSLYGGEYYHRVFNDYVEEPIDTFSASAALLSENPAPPIRVTRTLKPLRSWQPRPGLVRYDFGENIVGRMRLFPQGPAGRRYSLRFAEILHPDSSLNVDPLRSARSTDVYISLDTYPESWAPSFTYHGFRYAEVAVDEADSTSWEVIAEVMHNDVALKGTFSCGDSLLNEVYAATYRSLLGNLHSVPTDCPQRDERLGWMGDAQAFAPSANYAYEMTSFWKKWTQDMRDGQDSSGYVYDVNPPIVVRGPAKPGWGDAMTIIPWNAYVYAGDTAILADNYEAMSAWVAYMYARRKDHLYIFEDARGGQGFGDWVSVEPSDKALISAAFYARSTDLLARTAKILGKTTEARRLELRLDTIRQAFFQRFWAGKIESPASQTERLLTVAFGLCPGYESDMMTHLSKEITEQGHLTTGFLGTPFLLPLLSQFGYHELAWKIATRTEYPSWGYMLEQGATTIWEQWDVDKKGPQQGSRNHFALGPVGEWMYGSLAGIQPLEAHPGFQTFRLAPKIPEDLAWAKAAHESPYGLIVSGWHKFDGGIFWQLRIPPNSQAEVTFPAGFDTWQEGETFWWKDHVVQAGAYGSAWEEGEQGLRVILPAGTYSFKGM